MAVAVIDDDRAVLDSMRMLLGSHGVESQCFSSATEFLTQFESAGVSCIVCDVRMPAMTGQQLFRELKARGSIVPMILITGHGDVAMAVAALKEGAFDFIEKPFDDSRLVGSIRQAVQASDRLQSLQAVHADISARIAELTERQRQVMDLVVQGLSNSDATIGV